MFAQEIRNMSRFNLIAVSLAMVAYGEAASIQTAFAQPAPPLAAVTPEAPVFGLPFPSEVIPLLRNSTTNYSANILVQTNGVAKAVGTVTYDDGKLQYDPAQPSHFYMISTKEGELDTVFPGQEFHLESSVPTKTDPSFKLTYAKDNHIPSKIEWGDGMVITFQPTEKALVKPLYPNLDAATAIPNTNGTQAAEEIHKKTEDKDRRPEDR
jgi:hypothetical protein